MTKACPQREPQEISNYPYEEQVVCSFGRYKGPWRNKLVVEVKILGTITLLW